MQKITPHLWYDKEAREAAEFYTSTFREVFGANRGKSEVKNSATLHDTPSGDADVVTIELLGTEFMLLSAGPLFKFNPSISFIVSCDEKEEVDDLWKKLGAGGKVLMELDTYPFSERYGWTEDKYGLSWQIMHTNETDIKQR